MAVFKVPDTVPDAVASGANCSLATVVHGLERVGVGLGDTVVVQGRVVAGVSTVAAVVSGIVLHALFAVTGMTPERKVRLGEQAQFELNHTFLLNVFAVVVAAALFALRRSRTSRRRARVVVVAASRADAGAESQSPSDAGGVCSTTPSTGEAR